jgi:hypothetical protein
VGYAVGEGVTRVPGGGGLLAERWNRIRTAVACGTPDRVPVSLYMDAFTAQVAGVKLAEFVGDAEVGGAAMVSTLELLGDIDSTQAAVFLPATLGLLWLAPVMLPGRELPDDALWQLDEQVRIQPEDYDRIASDGWDAWYAEYAERYLGDALAAAAVLEEADPRWNAECERRGYAVFAPTSVDHPYEHLCGGRTVKEFTLDLFKMPDRVHAAMDAMMVDKREEARRIVRAGGPVGYWVGGWRTAPEFLSPRLWNRFVWPYMKELVEIVAEEGGIPVLHYDANWDREIERLLELPARRCVLALDGKTDIFRAKKILSGHMCILGDVPPALLTLGTPDEVGAYCHRLLTEVGPDGFILAMGCAVPPDAKFANVKALVDSVK